MNVFFLTCNTFKWSTVWTFYNRSNHLMLQNVDHTIITIYLSLKKKKSHSVGKSRWFWIWIVLLTCLLKLQWRGQISEWADKSDHGHVSCKPPVRKLSVSTQYMEVGHMTTSQIMRLHRSKAKDSLNYM